MILIISGVYENIPPSEVYCDNCLPSSRYQCTSFTTVSFGVLKVYWLLPTYLIILAAEHSSLLSLPLKPFPYIPRLLRLSPLEEPSHHNDVYNSCRAIRFFLVKITTPPQLVASIIAIPPWCACTYCVYYTLFNILLQQIFKIPQFITNSPDTH